MLLVRLVLLTALGLCFVPIGTAAEGLAALRLVPSNFWREVATIQDFVRHGWSPAFIAASPTDWVMAKITPEPGSGVGSGEDNENLGADLTRYAGKVKILHSFARGVPADEGLNYEWSFNEAGPDDRLLTHLVFGSRGGGVVCARITRQGTAVRFQELILIPSEWDSASLIASVALITPFNDRPWGHSLPADELLSLMSDSTPWIACAAMRVSLERGDIPVEKLLAALGRINLEKRQGALLQAILLGILLAHDSMAGNIAAISLQLGRIVGHSQTTSELRGMLLTAISLNLLSQDENGRRAALEVIQELGAMLRFRLPFHFQNDDGKDVLHQLIKPSPPPRRPRPDPSPDPLKTEVLRDRAIVQTFALWPLAEKPIVTALLRLTPDLEHGGAVSERGFRREPDGALIPLGRSTIDHVHARVQVQKQYTGLAITTMAWSDAWRELRPTGAKKPSSLVNAFTIGGLALAQIDLDQTGAARYSAVSLLPDAWESGMSEAYATMAAQPDWFRVATATKHRSNLASLMHGANPFLALNAGLQLIDGQGWEDDFVEVHVLPRSGLLQGMMLTRMLMLADAPKAAALTSSVRAFITNNQDADALYGVALAAHVIQRGLLVAPQAPAPAAIQFAGDAWWIDLLNKRFLPTSAKSRERQIVMLLHGL